MIVSGIIATLIMGFYGSIVEPTVLQLDNPFNWLMISVGIMLFTVMWCIWSNRTEFQQTVLLGSNLTKGTKTDFEKIKSWTDASKEDYYEAIIDEYVKCLRHAEEAIVSKSKRLGHIAIAFMIGLVSFPYL